MQSDGPLHIGRVVKACDRCHRQKLKCDPFRPCTLCTRGGFACTTSLPRNTAGSKRQRVESAVPLSERGRTVTTTAARKSPLSLEREQPANVHTPSPSKHSDAVSTQEFDAAISSIGFAKTVIGSDGNASLTNSSLIPGHSDSHPRYDQPWNLLVMQLPPDEVMLELMNKYFHAYHWYICLFNEHRFREMAAHILQTKGYWRRRDMDNVVSVLTISLLGLQAGLADDSWSGIACFRMRAIDPTKLLHDISTEIRHHIIDIVEDSKIEAVQICLLLATFHVYHDSPTLGWTLTTMAISVAYAIGLQHQNLAADDTGLQQLRSRCWNHTIVADTFALVVYGRPGLVDPTISGVHELLEMEETVTDPHLLNHPVYGRGNCPMTMTFHVLKAKLYRIIRHAVDKFRALHQSNQTSEGRIEALIDASQDTQKLLTKLRSSFPPLFEWQNWKHSDPWDHAEDGTVPSQGSNSWRKLLLQATMIQVLFNGAVILAHRPLLEYKISSLGQSKPSQFVLDSLRSSLDIAVNAALLISQVPIRRVEGGFCISFFFMHLFTAGVILSMAPASQPLSDMSQQAKTGMVKIIRASRQASAKNRVARHTERLLGELLEITLRREMENALKGDQIEPPINVSTTGSDTPSRNDFQSMSETLPPFPTRHNIDQQSTRFNPTVPSQVPDLYTPEQFELAGSIGSAPGDAFVDTSRIPFTTAEFPHNMWPFKGYQDMNINVVSFDEMMFNLLPSDNVDASNPAFRFAP